ncbi:DUF167 domain-containing protein [Candidatus Woesearchaeota archaeon]|nr:DUF167 domain-containing protein [Candidatus Woesearchaeota archaeon]
MEIKSIKFVAIVRPNSRESRIESFDAAANTYKISLKSKPKDNKANIELVNLLSRHLKKRIKISSGLRSREKIIETMD